MRLQFFRAAMAATVLLAAPLRAQAGWPELDSVAVTAEESPLLLSWAQIGARSRTDPSGALAELEKMLALIPQPTRFRAIIQGARAQLLDRLRQTEKSRSAIAEAIQLLPDSPGPKLLGTQIYLFSGDPILAADLWLAASKQSPDIARLQTTYITNALLGRLDDIGDHHADQIRARLIEIGYGNAQAYALPVIRSRIKVGDLAGAQQLLPYLLRPKDFADLLADRKFAALWSNIERFAGARLERQWPIYLNRTKGRWEADHSLDAGMEYVRALEDVDDPSAIVDQLLPALASDVDQKNDFKAQFLANQGLQRRSSAWVGSTRPNNSIRC
jgi:hypothetical protein